MRDTNNIFRAPGSAAVTADMNSDDVTLVGNTLNARLYANIYIEAGGVASSTGTVTFGVRGWTGAGSPVTITPLTTVNLTTTATAAKQFFSIPVESEYKSYDIIVDGTGSTWSVTWHGSLDPHAIAF